MGSNDEKEKLIKELIKLESEIILEMRRDFEEEKVLRDYKIERLREMLKHSVKIMLRRLALMEYALNKNYQELFNSINACYRELNGQTIKEFPRVNLLLCLREVSLRLHNYLSSVYSLNEHNKRFRKILDNQEFDKEYETKLKKIEKEEVKSFLIRLRVLLQHYNLFSPHAGIAVKLSDNEREIDRYLILDTNELLDFDKKKSPAWEEWINRRGWGSKAKKYIKNCGNKIELKSVIGEYQKSTKKLYEQIYKKVIELYSEKYSGMKEELPILEKIRRVNNEN